MIEFIISLPGTGFVFAYPGFAMFTTNPDDALRFETREDAERVVRYDAGDAEVPELKVVEVPA